MAIDGQVAQTGDVIDDVHLTARQIDIIAIIRKNPTITYRIISKQLHINESAVLKHLNNLKQTGIHERVSGTRGYWKVKQ
jgi:ATP-dependent DNA helicase RecG